MIAQTDSEAPRAAIVLADSFTNRSVPMHENGRFFGIVAPGTAIYAFDGDGRKLFETAPWLDGASAVRTHAMAASADGTFAIGGGALDGSDSTAAYFIARVDRGGRIARVDRQAKFSPARLRFGVDGTLWAIGKTPPMLEKPGDDQEILVRGFAPDGALRHSFSIPFPYVRGAHPADSSFLAGNGNLLSVLSTSRNELITFSQTGRLISRRKYPSAAGTLATGFAVSPSGDIYMSAQVRSEEHLVVWYRWAPDSTHWQEIYRRPSRARGGFHAIFEATGDRLLVSTSLPRLEWIPLPIQTTARR